MLWFYSADKESLFLKVLRRDHIHQHDLKSSRVNADLKMQEVVIT